MGQTDVASLMKSHIRQLVETWTQAVRQDRRISSDAGLSKDELIDHIPAVIEEICELLKAGEHPQVENTHEARANVYTRLYQGYRGRDLVRELSLLRLILLDHLTALVTDRLVDLDIESYARVARVINLYLDEEMRYAISVFSDLRDNSLPPEQAPPAELS